VENQNLQNQKFVFGSIEIGDIAERRVGFAGA